MTGSDHRIDSCRLLILPENETFSPRFRERLAAFDGAIMAREPGESFGVEWRGPADFDPVYYLERPDAMALSVYAPADLVSACAGAEATGRLFSGYHHRAASHLRDWLAARLDELTPEPELRCSNLYSFTRISLARTPRRITVQLLTAVPEPRGEAFAVEDEIELSHATVEVRLDGFVPSRCVSGPGLNPTAFELRGGYAVVRIPPFRGLGAFMLEK